MNRIIDQWEAAAEAYAREQENSAFAEGNKRLVRERFELVFSNQVTYKQRAIVLIGDTSGINYAEYYDKLIGLIQKGEDKDLSRITYYAQYLTYEYCKAVNHNANDILKTAKENAAGLFEVKWFFGVY